MRGLLLRLRVWRARRALRSADANARRRGAALLAGCPGAEPEALLKRALSDDHPLVVAAAAESLAAIGAGSALPLLLGALENAVGNRYLSLTLWEAVGRLTGKEADFDPNEPEASQRERIRSWKTPPVNRGP